MIARDVDQAAEELRRLRHEVWHQLGLAVAAFGLAFAASSLRPAFAVPLLIGGIVSVFLFVHALSRRVELIDRLILEPDAYAIPEVRKRGEAAATMKSRRSLATSIQCLLTQPGLAVPSRVGAAAEDLELLAEELGDEELALDPASAVACARLLNDSIGSPLRNSTFPPEDVRSRVRQILAGFRPRSV